MNRVGILVLYWAVRAIKHCSLGADLSYLLRVRSARVTYLLHDLSRSWVFDSSSTTIGLWRQYILFVYPAFPRVSLMNHEYATHCQKNKGLINTNYWLYNRSTWNYTGSSFFSVQAHDHVRNRKWLI